MYDYYDKDAYNNLLEQVTERLVNEFNAYSKKFTDTMVKYPRRALNMIDEYVIKKDIVNLLLDDPEIIEWSVVKLELLLDTKKNALDCLVKTVGKIVKEENQENLRCNLEIHHLSEW